MAPNCAEFFSENEDKSIFPGNGIISSASLHDLTTIKSMQLISTPKRDDYFCKRRKLNGNSIALPTGEAATERKTGSVCYSSRISSENPSSIVQNEAKSIEASRCDIWRPAKELYLGANGRWLTSVSDMPSALNTQLGDVDECSSSDHCVEEQSVKFMSARELCIFALKNHGLLEGSQSCGANELEEIPCDSNADCALTCKSCGLLEHSLQMIICDHCEEAFHLSCCVPRVKEISLDEWFCQPCDRKRPKCSSRKSWQDTCEHPMHRYPTRGLRPVALMLKDTLPYTSEVRIGENFQAEVPVWSAPFPKVDDYYNESSEVDPAELGNMNGWKSDDQINSRSISNWIQCQEEIGGREMGKRIVCGKWRRAPLFVVQSENWDCSCSVLWDPVHADCSVPQELETDEILKQLKFVSMLRNRLNKKKQVQIQGIKAK